MKRVIISILLVVTNTINASNFAIQPYPINFDQVPLSQTVLAGANVSFSCSVAIVNEQTLPQFIWYHNNTEITNGNISYTGINMTTLFISNVTEIDQGEYYCIFKDWETRTRSKSSKLTVYGDESIVNSQYLNVTLNETVILQCNSDGVQSAMIQWLWNGNTIDFRNKRYHKLQDGSLAILRISSSDDGEYSCEATLNGGYVKVKSYKIHTVSEYRSQINETVSLYPERSTHFLENMTIVCHIPSSPKIYNVTWIRNGTTIGLTTEDVEVYEYNLLKIRGMDVSAHEYKCMVYKNSSDESPATSPSLMVYKYSVPVVEHSNTTDYYICANLSSTDFSCVNGTVQAVNLYCNSVGGFPIPTVTWYHNGDEIINANVINGTLMLNKSACDLLGTYQCVVSNKVGNKIIVFRVLPFGWPNAPSIPEFSSEGKTVTINWKMPRYLGGLNNSLINYKTYKHNFAGAISLQDSLQENYHCRDTQCNITVEIRHLKNGGMEGFHVSLYIAKPVSMMCQGYNTPHVIASKRSEICFSNILEYEPPKVNLSCSDEGYVNMTSQPSGSLSAKELQEEFFVLGCTVDWTCTNGTAVIQLQNRTERNICNFNLRIAWRSYNCSVNVIYKYHRGSGEQKESTSKNCSSINYDIQNFFLYIQETTSIVLSPTSVMNEATMPIRMFNASKSNLFSESVPPVTASESVISVKLNETSSLVVSQTTTQLSRQVTPSLLPIEDKSSVVGSDLAVTALSLIITLVFIAIIIIVTGFLFKWKRKRQHVNSERTVCSSLDSIPKAYSYIGREDQSICEKPHAKVVNWINNLYESEETRSINNDLSNEQMLNDLYGVKMVKPIQRDSEKSESVVDTMDTRDSNDDNQTMKHTDDDETVKSAYSATPSSDCTCNSDKYSCKVAAEENSDDFMVDSMPSYTYNSVSPPGDNMKYVEVAHCENRSLSNAILRLQCNTLGIDDTSVSQPTNQPIDKHTPEDQDPFPYVSFSLKGYTAGSDTKTTLDDFSADYVQETI